jgi:hypothetical protein
MWDLPSRGFVTFEIDGMVPCEGWWGRPLFAKAQSAEAWPLLAEKAVAKWAGSYSKLVGGHEMAAWLAFTGCEEQEWWTRGEGAWRKAELDVSLMRTNSVECAFIKAGAAAGADAFRKYLRRCDKRNYLMAASIASASGGEEARWDGLVAGHSYSLLGLEEVGLRGAAQPLTLVQLRNPWGDGHEWRGGWSDGSIEWVRHAHVADELGYQPADDGVFWMEWDAFANAFTSVCICCMSIQDLDGQACIRRSTSRR